MALGIRAKTLDDVLLTNDGLTLHQFMRKGDRQRHEFRSLFASKPEHHALVACAFAVNTHGNVRALLAEHHTDAATLVVEALVSTVIASLADCFAHDVRNVDNGVSGYFTSDHCQTGGHQGFACHAARRILREHRVEDCIADLVRELVGVAHRDGFAGEQVTLVRHVGSNTGRNVRSERDQSDHPDTRMDRPHAIGRACSPQICGSTAGSRTFTEDSGEFHGAGALTPYC